MPSPIVNGWTGVAAGDSITIEGSWIEAFARLFQTAVPIARHRGQVTGRAGRVISGRAGIARSIVIWNVGVSGNKIGDLNVATQIAPFRPRFVFMFFGVNDVWPVPTPGPAFEATYSAKLAQIAALPTSPVIFVINIFCRGEQWLNVPPPAWGANADDAIILDLNNRIAVVTALHNGQPVDVRSALLAGEAIYNTPAPGVATGVFCKDAIPNPGVHPNETRGAPLIAAAVRGQVIPVQ